MADRKAVVVLNQSGQKEMLGLSLRKRLILNASEAGWGEFWLYHPEREQAWKAVLELSSDRRILERNIRFRTLDRGVSIDSLRSETDADYWLVLDDNLVLDPGVFFSIRQNFSAFSQPLARIEFQNKDGLNQPCPGLLLVRAGAGLDLVLSQVLAGKQVGGIEAGEVEKLDSLVLSSGFAVAVSDRESFNRALKLLLQTARKPQDGLVARLINRRVSLFLTRYMLYLNIHPVFQSLVTLAVGLLSVVFVGYGRQLLVPGGILFELASIIDGCDGENARLTYRITRTGRILDITGDAVTFVSFFSTLPLGLYRTYGEKTWLYLGAFTLLSMVIFYLQLINYTRRTGINFNIVAVVKEVEASQGLPGFQNALDRLASRLAFIYRRDFFSFAAFVLIVVGMAKLAMVLVAGLAFLEAVYFYTFSQRKLNSGLWRKEELP